jgi:hypothetical protein
MSPTSNGTFSTMADNQRLGSDHDVETVEESGTFNMGYITFFPKNDTEGNGDDKPAENAWLATTDPSESSPKHRKNSQQPAGEKEMPLVRNKN